MSTEARKQHLTDAEFSDLLAGEFPGAPAEAHLVACDFCRRELETVQGSMNNFQTVSMVWAQERAPRRVPTPSRFALRLGMRPSWGAGVAATAMGAILAFGLGLPSGSADLAGRFRPADHGTETAVATPERVAPTTTELAKDNRLMLSINEELSDQAQPAVPTSELRPEAPRSEHRPDAPVRE